MNERIRKLMLEAGYVAPELAGRANRLAELIIQECAGLTLDHRNADYYQGWLDYRDEIRQHWGIEP
jgi:hypothetical protein